MLAIFKSWPLLLVVIFAGLLILKCVQERFVIKQRDSALHTVVVLETKLNLQNEAIAILDKQKLKQQQKLENYEKKATALLKKSQQEIDFILKEEVSPKCDEAFQYGVIKAMEFKAQR